MSSMNLPKDAGSWNPKAANKQYILNDYKSYLKTGGGKTEGQRAQIRDESQQGAGNLLEAQNTQLAQQGLTGDVSNMNANIRASQDALSNAGAIGGAEANRLSDAQANATKANIDGKLQTLSNQRQRANEIWGQAAIDTSMEGLKMVMDLYGGFA